MDGTKLAAFVSLMIALSVATERLVEIVKGFVGFLGKHSIATYVVKLRDIKKVEFEDKKAELSRSRPAVPS